MNNNIKKAEKLIACYNKEHPNSCGCCCSRGPIGPTGATAQQEVMLILHHVHV